MNAAKRTRIGELVNELVLLVPCAEPEQSAAIVLDQWIFERATRASKAYAFYEELAALVVGEFLREMGARAGGDTDGE